jgi:hypothetical protein
VFFVVLLLDLGLLCSWIHSFFWISLDLVFPRRILFSDFDFRGRVSRSLSCSDFRCGGVQRAGKDSIFPVDFLLLSPREIFFSVSQSAPVVFCSSRSIWFCAHVPAQVGRHLDPLSFFCSSRKSSSCHVDLVFPRKASAPVGASLPAIRFARRSF